jgi:hypothetical protein
MKWKPFKTVSSSMLIQIFKISLGQWSFNVNTVKNWKMNLFLNLLRIH